MGFEDRDYYRDPQQPTGFQLPKPNSVVMWLIIINVVVLVVNLFFANEFPMNKLCSLHADLIYKPWNVWQLVTYGFLHSDVREGFGVFHIVMNMLGLFMFGRFVEERYGSPEFLLFYLAGIIFSGLVWIAWESAFLLAPQGAEPVVVPYLIGASGGVSAVVILFCLSFPQAELRLLGAVPIKAWVVGVIFVGMDLFNAITGHREGVAWQAHLGGAGFALLYFQSKFRLERLLPSSWLNRASGKGWGGQTPVLRVHRPDPEERYQALDEEADRILQKISDQGEASLTAKERRTLEDYSRRMRRKHR